MLEALDRAREARVAKRLASAALHASICAVIAAGVVGILRCSPATSEQPAASAEPQPETPGRPAAPR